MRIMRGVLFLRSYPTLLSPGFLRGKMMRAKSVLGFSCVQEVEGHKVMFFCSGFGRNKHVRKIPASILRLIELGDITDIFDVGAGGALDPELKLGDIVLSTMEIGYDGLGYYSLNRRPEAAKAAEEVAEKRKCRLFTGAILTHKKVVASRPERLGFFNFSCQPKVVQMEHVWMIDQLTERLSPEARKGLYFTHLEMVSDEVPREGSAKTENRRAFLRALNTCFFRNDVHLGPLKADFLTSFLRAVNGRA